MTIFPYLLFLLNQLEQVKKGGGQKKRHPPEIEKQQTKATVFNVYTGKKKFKKQKKTPRRWKYTNLFLIHLEN